MFQTLGPLGEIDFKIILEKTKGRTDFGGIPITANYVHDYWPFNWIDEQGTMKGIFKEIMEITTRDLNLTLQIQDPLEENKGLWFRK